MFINLNTENVWNLHILNSNINKIKNESTYEKCIVGYIIQNIIQGHF